MSNTIIIVLLVGLGLASLLFAIFLRSKGTKEQVVAQPTQPSAPADSDDADHEETMRELRKELNLSRHEMSEASMELFIATKRHQAHLRRQKADSLRGQTTS